MKRRRVDTIAFHRRRKRRRRSSFGRTRFNRNTLMSLGIETKFYDTSAAGAALTNSADASGGEHDQSATITPSTIIQGDGESNREGRKATFLSWHVTGLVHIPLSADNTVTKQTPSIFIAMILDKQTNGIQIASESVYLNDSGATEMSANLMRNPQQSHRFTVLKTIRFQMPQPTLVFDGTNIETGGVNRSFDLWVKFNKPIVANYSGTGETIANSTDRSLHILAWASVTTYAPILYYNSRLRFRG